jgi:hypothetical protein
MRTGQEIRKRIKELKNEALNKEPDREWERASQALEWVLEDTEKLLTY